MGKKNTIAYVDGYNLYHGIIDWRNIPSKGYTPFTKERPWGDLLWLNLESLFTSCSFPDVDLIKIKFFEAPSFDPSSLTRQQNYNNALLSLKTVGSDSFFGGEFKKVFAQCPFCKKTYSHQIEKKTDVLLATEMLNDFYTNTCESIILLSGDSDLAPTLEKIKKQTPTFPIYSIFPPFRASSDIKKVVGQLNFKRIDYKMLLNNQFPEKFMVNGFPVEKPIEYRRH